MLNNVEKNKLGHYFANGELSREVLDFMLQTGEVSLYDWIEIQSHKKEYLTKEEIKEKYNIDL